MTQRRASSTFSWDMPAQISSTQATWNTRPGGSARTKSMADDYGRYALSQRAAFEATHPAVLAAARQFASEPVLRVADLGAADGVNSLGLIRDLAEERAGRALIYALVDLPTNAWGVAGGSPAPCIRWSVRLGRGHRHPRAGRRQRGDRRCRHRRPLRLAGVPRRGLSPGHGHGQPPATVISMAGIPLEQAPCLPSGNVHVAVSGTTMHWVANAAGLASTGSVFPGYPDHVDEAERRGWRVAAAEQWERLLELRAMELAPGGRFIAALPASPAPCPDRTGLYVEIIGDMNQLLADWCRAGRISADTVAAVVVPVWMRTLDEIRAPFKGGGGHVAGIGARERRALPPRQSLLARRSRPCSRGSTSAA